MNTIQRIRSLENRLKHHDYEAIFTRGACFHFALRLHKRFGYPIRGHRIEDGNGSPQLSHVWAICRSENRAVDIRGVFPEPLLAAMANGGDTCENVGPVTKEELMSAIGRKHLPEEHTNRLFKLADQIFDTHERFEPARSTGAGPHAEAESLLEELQKRDVRL